MHWLYFVTFIIVLLIVLSVIHGERWRRSHQWEAGHMQSSPGTWA